MSNVKWVPPLPPNWEAKFDQNQRRYFFIDHRTKKTTWDDPRFSGQGVQKQVQVVPGQHAQHPQHMMAGQHPQHMQQASSVQQHPGYVQQAPPEHHSPDAHPRAATQGHAHTPPKSQMHPYQPQLQVQAQGQTQAVRKPVFFTIDAGTYGSSTVPVANESEGEDDVELVDLVSTDALQELKSAFPSCSETLIREKLERNFGITRLAAQDIEMAGYSRVGSQTGPGVNLSVEFPDAPITIIQAILLQFDNDVQKSRNELKEMGYKSRSEQAASSARHSTSPARHAGASSGRPATSSPLHQAMSPTQASLSSTRASASPTRTSADDIRLRQILIGEFPQMSQVAIDMALSSCQNDEQKTRSLLKSLDVKDTDVNLRTGSSKSPDRSAGSSKVSSPSHATLLPVRLTSPQHTGSSDAESSEQKKKEMTERLCTKFPNLVLAVVECALKSCHYNESRAMSLLTSTFKDNRGKYEAQSSSKNKAQKTTTKPAGKSRPRVTPPDTEVTTARQHVYATMSTSAYHRTALGPYPELHKGPDKSLLLLEYVQAKGPNPEIHHGANSSLVHGPQGAQGPDKSLPFGPQAKQLDRLARHNYIQTSVN